MDVIRCRNCRFAEQLEDEGGLVCKVRAGVGMFFVPDDGFCYLAEARSDDGKCCDCKHYREHKHEHLGDKFDGVCCKSERFAFSTMSGKEGGWVFEKR